MGLNIMKITEASLKRIIKEEYLRITPTKPGQLMSEARAQYLAEQIIYEIGIFDKLKAFVSGRGAAYGQVADKASDAAGKVAGKAADKAKGAVTAVAGAVKNATGPIVKAGKEAAQAIAQIRDDGLKAAAEKAKKSLQASMEAEIKNNLAYMIKFVKNNNKGISDEDASTQAAGIITAAIEAAIPGVIVGTVD